MIKKFTAPLLHLFLISSFALLSHFSNAQCSTYSFELDPPPDNGSYTPGQVIELCATVNFYQQTGANWIHGIIPTLPPGWDVTSFTAQDPPASCSGSGTWIWLDSHFQNGVQWGPGFYYDAGNNGNVINWGDPCSFGDWEFCITVTLDSECGGPGNPLNGEDITPGFILTGDGETGSWITTPFTCNSISIDASADYPVMEFNCCDAEAGVSPGTLSICNNGPFDLIDELGPPIDLGGTWTGPAGWTPSANGTFNPLTDPPGDYTYTVTGTDDCENSSVITMEFIDLGIVQFPGYCQTANISLCALVTNIACPPGGTWTDPNGVVVPGGILDPINMPPGVYTYEFIDGNNCPTTFSIDVTLASGGGSAGIPTVLDICTSDGSFCLLDVMDGNPTGGGQWIHEYVGPPTSFVGFYPNSNVCIDPTTLADNSVFTYALGIPPCTPSFVTLTLNVFDPVDVGELTQTSICVTDPPVVLETLLNGTPDPGLTWTNTATGAVIPGGLFDPSTVPENTTVTFVYSGGLALTSCFATQILELTILPDDAFAGNENTITLCESDDFIFMTDSLLDDPVLGVPQPGGTWTNSAGATVLGGFFVPGTTVPGTFTYTVSTSCGTDATTLVVNVLTTPDPGLDGILEICDNAVNVPLIGGLNGTPAPGGTWSPSGPNVNGNAVNDGDVFSYTTGPPLCQESATVTISLLNAPFAGTATTAPQIYCTSDPSFSLFTLLTTPPSATTGTWTGPSGFSGATLNPATAVTGNYTYTMPNTGCGGDTETIFITIETVPNAGTDATVTVCPNATGSVNLFASLGTGVTTGGAWTGPSGPATGTFNPGDPAGAYVYEVSSPSGQCTDQATVTVQLTALPSPGTNGAVTVCDSDPAFLLNTGLGGTPAGGGFWLNPSNGSVPGGFNAQFVPGTSVAGTYTYVIPVSGCPAVSATVNVTVVPEPNAGTNTSVGVCESAGVITLIDEFPTPPDGGGTWTDGLGIAVGGTYDVTGQGGSTQTFTYTVSNGTCDDSATITLVIENAPNAGPDVTEDFCATGAPFNLLSILDPGADAGGAFTGGNNIVLNAAASGNYTYVVSGTNCPNDNAIYTLNIDPAITTTAANAVCEASQTTYVVSFTIAGGDGNYTVNGTPSGANFTSAPIAAGTNYSFTVADGGPCGDITVSGASPVCTCPATAGFVGSDVTICAGETVDLELDLAGAGPFSVVYSAGGIDQPALTGLNNGDVITVSPGVTTTYELISVDDINCTGTASGQIAVTVETAPNAGPDVTADFCATGAAFNLITLLDPGADAGGSFVGGNNIVLNAAASGTYVYEVTGNACPDDQANYTINIDPQLTTTGVLATCNASQTTYTVTFNIAGGDGTYTVDGTPTGATFTSAPIPVGTDYNFTVADGGPCGDATVSGTSPSCTCPATASFSNGNASICEGGTYDLELALNGAGPFTIIYSAGGIDQPPITGLNDGDVITVSPAASTTYALVSVEDINCIGSASGSLTVTVENQPNAGPDVSLDYCATGAPFNLLTILDPGADAGGSFVGGNNIVLNAAASGTYTYEVQGSECPDDQAIYTLNIDPVLSTTGVVASCNAAQTSYTVTFNIAGGDGNYAVDGAATGGTFTSGLIPVGTNYSFVISDGGPCGDITVSGNSPNCACPATASFSNGNATICEGGTYDLELALNGAGPFTIIFSVGGIDQPPITGLNDGDVITVSPAATTTYALVSVEDINCLGSASGSIIVTVENQPNAGPDVTLDYCATGAPFNLLTILDPGADAGGSFVGGNNIVLNAAASGTYTYEVQGSECPDDQAIYTLNIDPVLSATGVVASCDASQANYTVTFNIAGGDGTYTVDGTPSGAAFTSGLIPVGTNYSFTIADGGPCGDITISGNSPNCNCPATASFSSGDQTICEGTSTDLVLDLAGAGPFTVVYSVGGVEQAPITGANDGDVITVSPTATTTYSLVSVEDVNCIGSASGTVTVTVETQPNAGPDVTEDLCATGGPLNLLTLLDPGADVGGSFIGGNNIVLNAAAAGTYTYEVQGNECANDQAVYTLNVDAVLSTTGLTAVCNPAQTDYVVTFTIAGGDGNYTVNGPTGNLVGNTFTSDPIPNGDDYSFTISDGGPCGDITVSGTSPDCNCTAQASITGTATICSGSSATLTFVLQGNGPFSVTYQNSNDPANPVVLNNIFNGHTINVSPTNNTTYTVIDVSDTNCSGIVTGTPVTITVNPPIVVSNVQETCDALGENYTVSFNIAGGAGAFFVLPVGGTINGGVYTSAPIPSGQAYSFSVDDAGACPAVTVDGDGFECPCVSDAGTISLTPIEVCSNENAQALSNNNATLDGNDTQQYILHNGNADSVGTVLATSTTGSFAFQGGLIAGQTYYIALAVGNTNGAGNVILTHPCTSVSTGVPVVFNELPSASITGAAQVCPGEPVDLTINFTGEGPWDFTYSVGGNESNTIFSASPSYTLTVTQPGTYTISQVSDSNCFGNGVGQATVTNYQTPTATMAGNPEVCENSGNGPEIVFTGQGPWTFVYAIDGSAQPPITVNFSNYTIPAEISGLYSLVSLTGPNCEGAVSGSVDVEIIDAPTATISGGGAVCAGDLADFNVALTGNGPWNIQYTIDGVPQQPLNTNNPSYTFQSGIDGDYVIVNVSDQNCSGEVISSSASLNVTPLPTGEIATSENILCIGQTLEVSFNMQGVGPFDIAYVINGDTIVANGVSNSFVHTMQPDEPVIAELVYIADGSTSGCSSEPGLSAFVQVSELPNAPVLTNDTICAGSGPVAIGVPSVPGMAYSWYPTTGLSDPNISNPTALLENGGLSPRTFAYILSASNGECAALDTVLITVDPGPRALFTYSPREISSEDPVVYFNNESFGSPQNTFFWLFDSLGTSEARNPVFRFPDEVIDNYTVQLTVTDPNTGCSDEYSALIPVKPEMLVFVPNAFTPDGDGLNELWGPVMRNVDESDYRLTIYDRFGQIVFETRDVKQKWNGGMNGSDFYVQSGIYSWTINTKNKMTQDEFEFTGHVTVVR